MLVVPWVAWLAIEALARYATAAERLTADVPRLVAALVVVAVTLPPPLAARAGLLAVIAGAAIALALRCRGVAQRARGVIAVLLLPATAIFVADRLRDVSEARGEAQMRFARTVSRLAPRGTSILALWDHVVPFRPTPVFHWFVPDDAVARRARGGRRRVRAGDQPGALDGGIGRIAPDRRLSVGARDRRGSGMARTPEARASAVRDPASAPTVDRDARRETPRVRV